MSLLVGRVFASATVEVTVGNAKREIASLQSTIYRPRLTEREWKCYGKRRNWEHGLHSSMSKLSKESNGTNFISEGTREWFKELGFWTSSIVWIFNKLNTRRFGDCICLRPQVKKGGEENPILLGSLERANLNQWLRIALSKGPNRIGGFPPFLLEDGDRSSLRNVVYLAY
jgi:hypothetical protein